MEELGQILKEKCLVSFLNRAKGCSEQEINGIERLLDLSLPSTYKEFLKFYGKNMGDVFVGSDFQYKFLEENQEYRKEILATSEEYKEVIKKAFVFLVHQGYIAYFFICDGNDNPPIFRYYEGEDTIRKSSESFSSFIRKAIEDTEREKLELKRLRQAK